MPLEIGTLVPVPALRGDLRRSSTVLPYLEAYHYDSERDSRNVYFTEHDINGNYSSR